jgi:hypothetical protein
MESSTGFADGSVEGSADGSAKAAPARHDLSAIRIAQVGMLLAAVGALFVVFHLIPMVGLVMTVVGAVLAARVGIGHAWFTAVAAGAALEVIARLLAEGSETLGGWLAVIASVMILCAVALGYPTVDRSRS